MDGVLPDGTKLPLDASNRGQGFNAVLKTTHRQNFLVPPRRHRSFPLVRAPVTDGGSSLPAVQALLRVLAAGHRVAEIGTAFGEGAAAMAETARELVTVEIDPERVAAAGRDSRLTRTSSSSPATGTTCCLRAGRSSSSSPTVDSRSARTTRRCCRSSGPAG